ncbi:fimbrial protein [Buttiauxella sp. A2-C2_NF]|uniref:fimbrial protein n=1 Tax=Buttiauxella ferragutiae TaxID=82989 RepID=UPI001E520894|nr:fimbrial protein [Buttiauxella ferragutiae]MCE0826493.1 fimbrial protein [Buttiauxella ferragutiae]
MKNINLKIYFLSLFASLFSISSAYAITGTDSVSATFTSTVEAGTCNAQIKDSAGAATSTISFGDVFKSDLSTKARVENFKLAFSGCSGVKSAMVSTQISGGCSGPSSDGTSYPNVGGTAEATAVEIWRGLPDSGTEFSCKDRSIPQELAISGSTLDVAMNARMVIANERSIDNVTAGTFQIPITFVITYK